MSQHLEENVAHLMKTVEELSDVMAHQDSELRRLRQQVDILLQREAAREQADSGGVILGDERPPHY